MAKKQASLYHSMKAHDLARITRERKLDKPNVLSLSEWADFLEADDVKRSQPAKAVSAAKSESDEDISKPVTAPKSTKAKG